MIDSSRSLMSVFVDVLIVRGGRRRNGSRVGRDRAGAGVTSHFRPCEQRLVTRTIDCADGDEEAVSWIEAERLSRDPLIIAFGNDDTLAVEVLVDRPGGYHEVVDIPILRTVERESYALYRIACGSEVLGCVGGPSQAGGHRGHDLRNGRSIAGRDELDQVIR